jgi:hypothetical protein
MEMRELINPVEKILQVENAAANFVKAGASKGKEAMRKRLKTIFGEPGSTTSPEVTQQKGGKIKKCHHCGLNVIHTDNRCPMYHKQRKHSDHLKNESNSERDGSTVAILSEVTPGALHEHFVEMYFEHVFPEAFFGVYLSDSDTQEELESVTSMPDLVSVHSDDEIMNEFSAVDSGTPHLLSLLPHHLHPTEDQLPDLILEGDSDNDEDEEFVSECDEDDESVVMYGDVWNINSNPYRDPEWVATPEPVLRRVAEDSLLINDAINPENF